LLTVSRAPSHHHHLTHAQAHLEAVRDEVLVAERAVLYTLSFQLRVAAPYQHLFALSHTFPPQHKHNLTNIAWSLLNDT
jgi:hypothetical protein